MPFHSNLQEQAAGSVSDLRTFFQASFSRATWLRTLISTIVVGLVFVFIIKGLAKLGGPGKKIASKVL